MAYAARCKADVFRRFPGLLDFSLRAFYPEHRDARDAMGQWIARQMDVLVEICFAHVDTGRFCPGVTVREVLDRMVWMSDGYLRWRRMRGEPVTIDELLERFDEWCAMFRQWAYGEGER